MSSPFVHTNTLGGSEEYVYKTKPVAIEKLEDGFRVERWHMGAEPPPFDGTTVGYLAEKVRAVPAIASHFLTLIHTPPRISIPPTACSIVGGSPRIVQDSSALAIGPI
jgi:hypothetical protein